MTTLVLLAHADPSVRAKYEAACGPGVVVRPFVAEPKRFGTGLSAPYQRMGQMLRRGGRILPQLLVERAAGVTYDHVVLGWWSGGYALAREVLASEADRDAIDACVGLDGGHATKEADGTPLDSQVEAFADFARLARDGRKVFLYGHSTIDPGSYSSTSAVAAEISRFAGPPERGWQVRPYDRIPGEKATAEHVRALHEWGPVLVAEACERLRPARGWWDAIVAAADGLRALPGRLQDALPSGHDVGTLALEIARHEAATVREATGANDGPVSKYFLDSEAGPTVRRRPPTGPVGSPEDKTGWWAGLEWCGAGCTYSVVLAALRLGVPPPVQRRMAVWEIVRDARETGRLELPSVEPVPGWYAIFGRLGQDPRIEGQSGHVAFYLEGSSKVRTLDPNAGVAWGYRERPRSEVLAWVRTT